MLATVLCFSIARHKIINTDDNMIKINNAAVPFSISTMSLRMYIDNNLTLNAHTKHVNKFFSKGVGVLSRLRNELAHKILLLIVNTLILPYATYCCIILGLTYKSHINKTFTTQKKALRIISNYRLTSPIFMNHGLLNIHQHIQYHDLIFMFQQQNNLLPNLHE